MSLSSRISSLIVFGTVLAIVGCGDHGNTHLDGAQRGQLAQEVQINVFDAIGGGLRHLHGALAIGKPMPAAVTTCTGSAPENCTIPAGSTIPCIVSGDTKISGTFSDTTSTGTTGDLIDDLSAADVTLDPVACNEDNFLILDGDSNVVVKVVSGQDLVFDLTSGDIISGEITEVGRISFKPASGSVTFPSGTCSINATVSFADNVATAKAGSSICGKTESTDTVIGTV